jgi:23S rRNA (guanosine2251-2'-O)-methyltransferase
MGRPSTGPPNALYGINAVREAIGNRSIDYVLVAQGQHGSRLQEIVNACRAHGISLRFAPRAAVERAAGTSHHQNVVAITAERAYDDFAAVVGAANDEGTGDPALLVVLDGVDDPANLGAVLRTVVAVGARGVIIPERRAAGLSPAVARAAAGALEHARVVRVTNLVRALTELKEHGIWVYGFAPDAPKPYLTLDLRVACALVLGGEGHGLHRLVREACDEVAKIPIRGPVESLNVSVAAAVVLYEAIRQRSHQD